MKKKKLLLILLLLIALILLPACQKEYTTEDIREIMEEALYEKYGEEFVVDRIGKRTANRAEFYQARIYPKSIIGTEKEYDSYYYASASVDILSNGRLGGVGDSYSYVLMNKTGEAYLLPKAKEIFGDRILLKVDSEIKIWGREDIIVEEYRRRDPNSDGVDAFIGYKESDFRKARERVIDNPNNNKLMLDLDVYIFKRIEDEEEKEERREQIFEFVQYLKEEGLFEYLELGVIFIDERVLAPSYSDFRREIYNTSTVREEIEGETVRMPPRELRERMSIELQEEVDDMSDYELLASMEEIMKSELRDLRKYNADYGSFVYSIKLLEAKYASSITEEDRKRDYSQLDNIRLVQSKQYIYLNIDRRR